MTPALPTYRGADHEDHRTFLLNWGLRDHTSYLFADQYVDAWRPKARELVLARLRAQVQAGARELDLDDPLVVIKEPQSHGAELLMSLLPASRLVFLLRDGREVVRSMLALYGPGGRLEEAPTAPAIGDQESRLRFVRDQSRLWVQRTQSVNAAFAAHSPESRLKVRYEDFEVDTVAELRRVSEWMGLDRTDDQIRDAVGSELSRRRPSGSGRRKDDERDASLWELTPAERRVADELMAPMLVEVGYDV